jgi:hypothetical protein
MMTLPPRTGAYLFTHWRVGLHRRGIPSHGDCWRIWRVPYNPTGTLSGVTTLAIIIWLVAWFVLARQWGTKTVDVVRINWISFALLAVGFLLTFPPFMDLLQGK